MSKIFINVDGVDMEATGQALQDVLDFQAECKAKANAKQAEAEAQAIAKAAILDRIGLTADELKTILG
jgi:hypothetical protein